MKFLKGFLKLLGYTLLLIIGLGTAQKFSQWFAPYLLANYPYLVLPVFLLIIGGFILASSKRLRKVFVNIFREFYKNSRFLVPKNKLTRLVLNIGFIVVWYICISFLSEGIFDNSQTNSLLRDFYRSDIYLVLMWSLFLVPILFITQFFWLEDGFRDIANTFIKAGLTKKDIKRRFKTTAKSLSKSNISDADELKKYADLRDQGIITEEEFQAKKKILLDL